MDRRIFNSGLMALWLSKHRRQSKKFSFFLGGGEVSPLAPDTRRLWPCRQPWQRSLELELALRRWWPWIQALDVKGSTRTGRLLATHRSMTSWHTWQSYAWYVMVGHGRLPLGYRSRPRTRRPVDDQELTPAEQFQASQWQFSSPR